MRGFLRGSLLVAAVVAAAAAAGCSDDPETGVIRVQLSDAPYPFPLIASAEVTVDRLEAHLRDEGADEFRVLDGTVRTLNLLELRNGVTEQLAQAEVPVGFVDQLRLRVTAASVVLTDGRRFDLQVPSGSSSGLKVFPEPDIEVVGGLTTDLVLDFDVSESFQAIPSAPTRVEDITGFQFHPVLRVANLSETGTVSGVVVGNAGTPLDTTDDEPVPDATVRIVLTDGTVLTTVTNADGAFAILGVPAGAQTLTVSAPGYLEVGLAVTIVAGNEIGTGALVLVETPAGP